jgi:hypothetical protein
MNKTRILIHTSYFISCLLIYLFLNCSACINTLSGHTGMSQDIQESKKRKVFVCEYIVPENPFRINDSLQINLKRAWLEKHWGYPENISSTLIGDGYQLILEVSPNDVVNHSKKWLIGVDFKKNFRSCGDDCIMTDFDYLPSDTIDWDVQKGFYLNKESEHIIIGKFQMIKKS